MRYNRKGCAKWVLLSAKGGSIRMSGGERKFVKCKSYKGFNWRLDKIVQSIQAQQTIIIEYLNETPKICSRHQCR